MCALLNKVIVLILRMDSQVPSWVSENNLQATGVHFEGFFDDLEAVLDYRRILTVSMYL